MNLALIALCIAGVMIVCTIPFAVVDIIHARRWRRQRQAREHHFQIVSTAEYRAELAQRDVQAMLDRRAIKLTRLGDKRRRTSHTAEFLKPTTQPIVTLPDPDPIPDGQRI
jgi:hypothetical protein